MGAAAADEPLAGYHIPVACHADFILARQGFVERIADHHIAEQELLQGFKFFRAAHHIRYGFGVDRVGGGQQVEGDYGGLAFFVLAQQIECLCGLIHIGYHHIVAGLAEHRFECNGIFGGG